MTDEFVWSDKSREDKEASIQRFIFWWLSLVGKSKDANSVFGLGDDDVHFGQAYDPEAPVLEDGDIIRHTEDGQFELIR